MIGTNDAQNEYIINELSVNCKIGMIITGQLDNWYLIAQEKETKTCVDNVHMESITSVTGIME